MRPYLSTLRYVKCHYDTAAETAKEFYRASEEAILPPASESLQHQVLLRCHLQYRTVWSMLQIGAFKNGENKGPVQLPDQDYLWIRRCKLFRRCYRKMICSTKQTEAVERVLNTLGNLFIQKSTSWTLIVSPAPCYVLYEYCKTMNIFHTVAVL